MRRVDTARRAEIHDFAAALAGAGAEVQNAVALTDDLRVVLHHHDGVPVGLEVVQDAHQAAAVARVQADARLVEDVQRIDQRRAQRRGQVDPLHLAAGQGARLAVERQIIQPDGHQVAQAAANLAEQQGDGFVVQRRGGQILEEVGAGAHGQGVNVRDGAAADARQQRLGFQAGAAAVGAGNVAAVARQEDAHVHAVGSRLQPGEPAAQAEKLAVAVDDHGLLRLAEAGERHVGRDAVIGAEGQHEAPFVPRRLGAPRLDGALGEALAAVRDDQVEINVDGAPEALAELAGTQRAVEREEVGDRIAVGQVARWAMQVLAESQRLTLRQVHRDAALAEAHGLFERVQQAGAAVRLQGQAVDHHLDGSALGQGGQVGVEPQHLAVDQQAREAQPLQPQAQRLGGLSADAGVGEADRGGLPAVLLQQRRHDAAGRAALHRLVALPAVQLSHLGEQQPHVVGQLGHGADRGAGVLHRVALVDGDGRRDALDVLDLRLVHALQELPRVGRKALHVAPLPLGVQRVERQAGLARAADAGDDEQLVQRDVQRQVLEVVVLGANDADDFGGAHGSPLCSPAVSHIRNNMGSGAIQD